MDPKGIMGGGPPPGAPGPEPAAPPPRWDGAPPCIPLVDPSSAFSSSRRLRQAAFGFKFRSKMAHVEEKVSLLNPSRDKLSKQKK